MWRRSDSRGPWALAWLVLAAQLALAAVLSTSVALRALGLIHASALRLAFTWVGLLSALCVLGAAAWVLIAPMQQSIREHRVERLTERWIGKWVIALLEREIAVPTPLPLEAQSALLTLQDHLKGEDAEALKEVAHRYNLGQQFSHYMHPTRTDVCLDALEALAKVKLADTVPVVLAAMVEDRRAPVRRAAARAAARTIADMPDGVERDLACLEFSHALGRAELPIGVQEECLGLLGPATGTVIATLFMRHDLPEPLHRACIECAGRARLADQADRIARDAAHASPELRAGALRALRRIGHLPQGAEELLRASLSDPDDRVRIQGAHAACLLPVEEASQLLWKLLGDRSWWVRRAAAHALRALDPGADSLLERASREHPDRYARELAALHIRRSA